MSLSDSDQMSTTVERPSASESGADDPVPGRARGSALLWLLAATALVSTAVAAWLYVFQYRPLADEEAARSDVPTAAINFMSTLTTWDATDGLDETREALVALGTESFAGEVGDVFGEGMDDLSAIRAVSSGQVEDVFVQALDGGEAVVFAVVRQTIDSQAQTQPTVIRRNARLTLHRQDGAWRVAAVELVHAELISGPDPTSPSNDATPTDGIGQDDAGPDPEGETE